MNNFAGIDWLCKDMTKINQYFLLTCDFIPSDINIILMSYLKQRLAKRHKAVHISKFPSEFEFLSCIQMGLNNEIQK